MKKLLALMAVGGLLALTAGCPPATTSEEKHTQPPKAPGTVPPAGTPEKDKTPAAPEKDKTPAPEKDKTPAVPEKDKTPAPEKDKTPAAPEKDKVAPEKDKTPAPEKDKAAPAPEPIKGKVTKSEGGKITVEGKEYAIPETAKVTIDGKEMKASDIKADSTATITVDKDGKVTAVEVKTK